MNTNKKIPIMKYLLILLFTTFVFISEAQITSNKNQYDIDTNSTTNLKSGSLQDNALSCSNDMLEFLIMRDGYFTVGTNNGKDASTLDDKCQITYGHPYSLTSFPVFVFDGVKQNSQSFFANSNQQLIRNNNGSISLIVDANEMFICTFNMAFSGNGNAITLTNTIEITDNEQHTVASGFLFDAALGKNGDGCVYIDNNKVSSPLLIDTNVPEVVEVWEYGQNTKGLGVKLKDIDKQIASTQIGNWFQMSSFAGDDLQDLYDVAIKVLSEEQTLIKGQKYSCTLEMELLTPDFDSEVFVRWDAPSFLSIENNMLFPAIMKTYVELSNLSETYIDNISYQIVSNDFVDVLGNSETFSVDAQSTTFLPVSLEYFEIYESTVIPLEFNILQNEEVLFTLKRNVFCPAMPFSNEGIDVKIDSVYTANNGDIKIVFSALIEQTGQLIYNLRSSNLFFYVDGERYDTVLEKDTTGGVNQADIVFVLDVTGSMGNEIDEVKNRVVEFADNLEKNGIDYRLGMVTFLDEIESIFDFTSDVFQFKEYLTEQYAHGGGDGPENSLEALMNATFFDFRSSANRIVVWITDAEYHNRTQYTLNDVIEGMLANGIQVHCVGTTDFQTQYYDQLIMNTGGNFYDINGNFRDILLDISKMQSSGKYILTVSQPTTQPDEITVEVHYAGLGGSQKASLSNLKIASGIDETQLVCYPNPFTSNTTIRVENPLMLKAKIELYDYTGRCIETVSIPAGQRTFEWHWNTSNTVNRELSEGIYLLKLQLYSESGSIMQQNVEKLLLVR